MRENMRMRHELPAVCLYMMNKMMMAARHAATFFAVPGELVSIIPLDGGNVNDTFVACFRTSSAQTRVIVQRINQHVFRAPGVLIDNMFRVTTHVHDRLSRERPRHDRVWQLPRIIKTTEGKNLYIDSEGRVWRALSMIESATAFTIARTASHAEEMGRVLGMFHGLLSDFDGQTLADPLPGFHVTPAYLARFDATCKTPGARQRLAHEAAAQARAFIEDRRQFGTVLEDAKAEGLIKDRVIHGDPKVSNFMIDDMTGQGIGIIDLDTVKSGLIHYDLGDALRSLCNTAGEETKDMESVTFDTHLCRAFLRGYLVDYIGFLTANERRYLYDAIRLLAFELGLRFFEDYLAGSPYFKVTSADQNLHRARVQFRLCEAVETARAEIGAVIREEILCAEKGRMGNCNGQQHAAPLSGGRCRRRESI